MENKAEFFHIKSGTHKVQRSNEGRTQQSMLFALWVFTTTKVRHSKFLFYFFFFFSFLPSFKCTIISGFGHFKAFVVSHSETFCTLCFYCDGVITTVVFFQCHSLSAKYESYCFDYFDERGIFRKSYANIMGTQGCPETLTMLCMYTNE